MSRRLRPDFVSHDAARPVPWMSAIPARHGQPSEAAVPEDADVAAVLPSMIGTAVAPHPLEGSETSDIMAPKPRRRGYLMGKRPSRFAPWPSFDPPLTRGPSTYDDAAAAAVPPPAPAPVWAAYPDASLELAVPPADPPSPLAQICGPGPAPLIQPVAQIATAPFAAPADEAGRRVFGLALARAAMAQAEGFVIYSIGYARITYPRGDVPALYGVCTDVVVRAYRTLGIDLQELVHVAAPRTGDRNIQHRRTEVLRQFFQRNGASLPVTDYPEDYLPGDIVTYHRPNNRMSKSHIAIVTDIIAPSGRPMVVHNRGWGVQIEDALFIDRVTGHYRYFGPAAKAGTENTTAPSAMPGKSAPAVPSHIQATVISAPTAWSASGPAPECSRGEHAIMASRAARLCAPALIAPARTSIGR